jgi:RNA polymerase sigma-70 factor (ECF subfamily)
VSSTSFNPRYDSWELLNQLTDEQLAAQLLAGEHTALAVLFDRYHKVIYGVALRIVRDAGEAEEVVQTVFFDAFRSLANFDRQKGSLRTWLVQCAYARALNRRRHLTANHFYDVSTIDPAALGPLFCSFDADFAELSCYMEQLLATLSARRRAVIELTYFEGLTATEIAERLVISVDAVRHELYRGLARLRAAATKSRKPAADSRKSERREALATDAQTL